MTQDASRGPVKAPQDLLAGVSLMLLCILALWAGSDLVSGRLGAPGPGLVPRVVAVLVGVLGAVLVALSLLRGGEPLGSWALRGPVFVSLGVVAFALTIRTAGLCLAGPLVVMISGAASPEARFRELAIFSVGITALCVALFRYLLHLPVPILIIPGHLAL